MSLIEFLWQISQSLNSKLRNFLVECVLNWSSRYLLVRLKPSSPALMMFISRHYRIMISLHIRTTRENTFLRTAFFGDLWDWVGLLNFVFPACKCFLNKRSFLFSLVDLKIGGRRNWQKPNDATEYMNSFDYFISRLITIVLFVIRSPYWR